MKVIVIPDDHEVRTIDDNGEGCHKCIFSVREPDSTDVLTHYCGMHPECKPPCINTIYAVVHD